MIAIFDSGIGGFEFLSLFRKKFPTSDIFYYADLDNFPYGPKDPQLIKNCVLSALQNISTIQGVSKIFIACNTASFIIENSFANLSNLSNLSNLISSNVSIVSTIKYVEKYLYCDDVVLICTELTKNVIKSCKQPKCSIVSIPNLANLVQCERFDLVADCIKSAFHLNPSVSMKKIVYGCTHYPMVHQYFIEQFPETEFFNPIIDIVEDLPPHVYKNSASLTFNKPVLSSLYCNFLRRYL